jgi:hypothetical protein
VMAFSVDDLANGISGPSILRRSVSRGEPPENEEVAATERASEGQKQPVESCLKGVPVAYSSEIDRSAMWAPCKQHTLQYRD